jgi:hypothetical protein
MRAIGFGLLIDHDSKLEGLYAAYLRSEKKVENIFWQVKDL